jgi:hypothetical protein
MAGSTGRACALWMVTLVGADVPRTESSDQASPVAAPTSRGLSLAVRPGERRRTLVCTSTERSTLLRPIKGDTPDVAPAAGRPAIQRPGEP